MLQNEHLQPFILFIFNFIPWLLLNNNKSPHRRENLKKDLNCFNANAISWSYIYINSTGEPVQGPHAFISGLFYIANT